MYSGSVPQVLLVDDEPFVRSMLKAVLETDGYSVTIAVSAAEARAKLVDQSFDVVITDMRMETDISGYEVVRAARRRRENPVVIIMTAFPLSEEQWRHEGADAGMMKPVPMNEMLASIHHLLQVRRANAGQDCRTV